MGSYKTLCKFGGLREVLATRLSGSIDGRELAMWKISNSELNSQCFGLSRHGHKNSYAIFLEEF